MTESAPNSCCWHALLWFFASLNDVIMAGDYKPEDDGSHSDSDDEEAGVIPNNNGQNVVMNNNTDILVTQPPKSLFHSQIPQAGEVTQP